MFKKKATEREEKEKMYSSIQFNSIYLFRLFSQNNKSGKENTKQIKKPWSSKKTKAGHLVTGPQNKNNAHFGIS